jgi:NitT/TauT family transport system ATP-binding protein
MSMDRDVRIRLDGVSKSFPAPGQAAAQQVLSHISLELRHGEFVCLLGASGCGKSTLLNLVAGFEQPDSGRLLCDGRAIAGPGPDRGMVFQQPTLFPWLSVRQNVGFGPRMAGQRAPGCRSPRYCSWTSPSARSTRRRAWRCRSCSPASGSTSAPPSSS